MEKRQKTTKSDEKRPKTTKKRHLNDLEAPWNGLETTANLPSARFQKRAEWAQPKLRRLFTFQRVPHVTASHPERMKAGLIWLKFLCVVMGGGRGIAWCVAARQRVWPGTG